MSISDGDIWASDSEIISGEFQQEETAEIRKLRSVHAKRGYLDGITSAKDENLQQGFDSSYNVGSALGLRVGVILGELQVLTLLHGENDEPLKTDLKRAQQELRINKVLSKQNFDQNFNLVEEQCLIKDWETTLNEYRNKYKNVSLKK
ncbi:LAME_0D04280g1_1 [Lachancea meyersii CBS 8951]|uniref:Protein YAE1 n=1 Tax=Lachancea meyersii CBS 8951 TaxID=1266667 RepID=A0A1G4J7Z1_9SACH|nr:LAME_0D04280g1_1 [Lachancea meyersii CBS 8951]